VVIQVSRWDRLKDMAGVMRGFADHVALGGGNLLLVGPAVAGVSDDPEGAAIYGECLLQWHDLPAVARARVLLVTLPLDDIHENAAMVNTLQRHATVIAQKSLAEGFGLTVSEGMWKGRPVIGSAAGGIIDQIAEGTGILLPDPTHLKGVRAGSPPPARRPGRGNPDGTGRASPCSRALLQGRAPGALREPARHAHREGLAPRHRPAASAPRDGLQPPGWQAATFGRG
jgi:trehalose synthase